MIAGIFHLSCFPYVLPMAVVAFVPRIIQTMLKVVAPGIVQVAHAMRSTTWQIVCQGRIPGAIP